MPPSADPAALHELGALVAAEMIRAGTLSPVALVKACLARIAALDRRLEAWIEVDEAGALAAAAEREAEATSATIRGPLHGVPIGLKDLFATAGMVLLAAANDLLLVFLPLDLELLEQLQEDIPLPGLRGDVDLRVADADRHIQPLAPTRAAEVLRNVRVAELSIEIALKRGDGQRSLTSDFGSELRSDRPRISREAKTSEESSNLGLRLAVPALVAKRDDRESRQFLIQAIPEAQLLPCASVRLRMREK